MMRVTNGETMKTFTVENKSQPNKFGDVQFTWSAGDGTIKVCTQHSAQPAIFFRQLLEEAGYEHVAKAEDVK